MKILIVEDSPTQAERLKNVLEQNGHQISVAINGKDALNQLNNVKPNLLISDIMMPEMNGYELCKRVRQHANFKNLLIILLTTLSDTDDIIAGLECGANYIITKPYDDNYLLGHINAAMETQKLRQIMPEDNDVKVVVKGHEHTITSEKSQILDLLISIYDAAVIKNRELYNARVQLQELNNMLEKKVDERTTALRIEMEERKRYEKQFLESQKLESIGQLAGGIAHDFNNLLMIMQCNVEMLKPVLKNDDKSSKRVDEALAAMHRGTELIKRLMAFSRRQQLQPKLLNLQEVISNMINLLIPMLGAAIEINTNFPQPFWSVYLDPGQLENALVNLAVNARDAMKGKGTLTIEVSNITAEEVTTLKKYNLTSEDYVKITVSDNGEGIPPEIVDRVFEPFFTTKETGKGTGLGLSMVYGFIKQSKGHVTINSKVGAGTTVTLYLPKASEVELPKEDSNNAVMKLNGKEKILLVEDETSLRQLTAEYLQNLGYHVLQAENGTLAFDILQKEQDIKLLLTDIIMPGGLLGTELVELAQKKDPKLKILFVSGYPKNILLNEKKLTNINYPLLLKPYTMIDLGVMLRTILDSTAS